MMPKDDYQAYLSSWGAELASQAHRVRQLIGDAHWLSDGHHKEALIRDFLERYVPPQLTITTGFVLAARADQPCSPEIDVMVVDPAAHLPLFAQSELSIVAPASILAHLQIKSAFGATELRDALHNVSRVQDVIASGSSSARVWRAIIFYRQDESRTPGTVMKTLENELAARLSVDGLHQEDWFPTCVVCLTSWVAFLSFDRDKECLLVRWFDAKDLSIGCALADLFAAVRWWLGGAQVGRLDEMVAALPLDSPHVISIPRRDIAT